jgi:hypothetical protein
MRKLLEKIDPLKLVVGTLLLTLAFLVLRNSFGPSWIANVVASLALTGFTIIVFKLADYLSDLIAVILAMWLPITVTTVAGVLLFYEGQGRDLGVGLLGEGNPKLFILFCVLIYWAVNNWHSARLGLDYAFPAPTGTEHWLFWSPRLVGVSAHLFAAISLALASWSLLPLAEGSSPVLKPSDWLVFTAPFAIVLVTASVWAFDYTMISERPKKSATARRLALGLRIVSPICVFGLFVGLGYASYYGKLPEGLLPGTLWISASACAFLVFISIHRSAFSGTPTTHDGLTLVLAGIALFVGALIWYSSIGVGDRLGSLNICFFAFGAALAILNLFGWFSGFFINRKITIERAKFAGSGVAFLLLLAALTSLLRDFHRVRLCAPEPCSSAPAFTGWSPIKTSGDRPTVGEAALAWYEQADRSYHKDGSHKDKPVPMLVIATAGGGIRAAFWTATVLQRLQADLQTRGEKLEDLTFAISGVSGGSVGAMDYVAALHMQAVTKTSIRATDFLQSDLLAPGIASLVFVDGPSNFLPDLGQIDRGTALERSFERASKGYLAHSFLSFFPDVRAPGQSWRPALLLNATHEETGRRIIASNLKIEKDVFLDSFDELNLLESDMRASTVAHNSARFTYVSPAGKLQLVSPPGILSRGTNRGYVIDGGYFENYGALTALELARQARSEIEKARGRGAVKLVVLQISSDPTLTKERTRVRTIEDAQSGCALTTSAPDAGSNGAANFLKFEDSGFDAVTHRWKKNDGEGWVVSYLNELAAPLQGIAAVRGAHGTLAAAELAAAVCTERRAPSQSASAVQASLPRSQPAAINDLLEVASKSIGQPSVTNSPPLTMYGAAPHFAHLVMCDVSDIGKAPIVPPLGWVLSKPMRDSFQKIIADCGNEAELGRLEQALD